jgi:HK97 family phage portal protein
MGLFDKLFKAKTETKAISTYSNEVIEAMINNGFTYNGNYTDNKLINEGYASNADVYAIIKKVSETAANIPLVVESKTSDGWEIDETSLLNDLLNNPNDTLTGTEFRYNNGVYLLNTGDNFWKKTQDAAFGLVTELNILEPNLTELIFNTVNEVMGYEYHKNGSQSFNYTLEEVIHSMYLNPSVLGNGLTSNRGLSPLQAGYNILNSNNNRAVATGNMIENGGAYGILSSGSDLTVSSDEADRIQKQVNTRRGGSKGFGSVITSMDNFKFTNIGMDATQLKMIEGGLVDLRTLCNLFGVDSTMFNDKESSTLDNVKVANKKLYTDAAIPLNAKYILPYEKDIIPTYNQYENKELRIVQDLSNIDALQEDQNTKAVKDSQNVASLVAVMGMPISTESKIAVLVDTMGMDENTAQIIIGTEIVQNETV